MIRAILVLQLPFASYSAPILMGLGKRANPRMMPYCMLCEKKSPLSYSRNMKAYIPSHAHMQT